MSVTSPSRTHVWKINVMCSEDGRISFTEFNDELEHFVQKSKALGDDWEVRLESDGNSALVMLRD